MLRLNPITGILEMAPVGFNPNIVMGEASDDPNTPIIEDIQETLAAEIEEREAKEQGTRGPEMITNGNFETDLTTWEGENWSWDAGKALHAEGSIIPLSQAGAAVAEIGETYLITYDLTSGTAGSVRLYYGGVFGAYQFSTGIVTEYITATAAEGLKIVPTSDFNGKIDLISCKKITTPTPAHFETPIEFRKNITVFDKIIFPDGRPIAIGFNALRLNTTGEYNVPSSNVAIGFYCGALNTTGHITAVGYYAGSKNTTGVLTAFGKWAGFNNTSGHATFFGNVAGFANTTAQSSCFGDESGRSATTQPVDTFGYYAGQLSTKTIAAFGVYAAQKNVTGEGIAAFGYYALANTTASYSSAFGYQAGLTNTTGIVTAFGYRAAYSNTTGQPTAVGYEALTSNTTGKSVGIGERAGFSNTTGSIVAVGFEAGRSNLTGHAVTIGWSAGWCNTTGSLTAIGYKAGYINSTGSLTCIGHLAGTGTDDTNAPQTDTFGILIGHYANRSVPRATVLTNYIGIGYGCLIDKSNQVKIGNSAIVETVLYGTIRNETLATYADNAAALAGGLTAGDIYKVVTGELRIVV